MDPLRAMSFQDLLQTAQTVDFGTVLGPFVSAQERLMKQFPISPAIGLIAQARRSHLGTERLNQIVAQIAQLADVLKAVAHQGTGQMNLVRGEQGLSQFRTALAQPAQSMLQEPILDFLAVAAACRLRWPN